MGGLERNTLTICLALEELGHEVHLITETLSESEDDYPFAITRTRSLSVIYELLSKADFLLVNGNISLRIHPAAWIRQVPYGVVYATFRGYKRAGGGFKVRMGNTVRGFFAQQASANIFLGTYAEKKSGLPEDSTYVVPNPVDKWMQQLYDCKEREQRPPDAPFLFAGRIIEGKGVFVMAQALEKLDGDIDMRVIVAGEGRDEEKLRAQTQDFATIQVEFAGRLDSEDLVDCYQSARALLVPSTTHKEGNPLVIAEAIYAGTPVIASDQPPMIESVGDAGIIVKQGSSFELAGAMRTMQTSLDTYSKLRENAKSRADRFGFDRYLKRLEGIFGASK
jgi:glycosyltransferase involved in cell wall biosynthesis